MPSTDAQDGEAGDNPCCKVSRVTSTYALEGMDTELKRRYEIEDATLHDLSAYLNARITAAALDAAGIETDAEPATVAAALREEDSVSLGLRDQIRETIAGKLDIAEVTSDFVSHETIRKHLKDHLGISTSKRGFETTEELEDVLDSYQAQYRNAIESTLKRAATQGLVNGSEFRVFRTQIQCEECSQTYRLEELMQNGGCDCHQSS